MLENQICQFLTEQGFQCVPDEFDGEPTVNVSYEIAGHTVKLLLFIEKPFLSLPRFLLLSPSSFGKLAHVKIVSFKGAEYGAICVNAPESVSVNFDRPLLLIKDSLERHIALLKSAMTNPEWNNRELLREFYSNWLNLCDAKQKPLLINFSEPVLKKVDVYEPLNEKGHGLHSYYVAHPSDSEISELSEMQFGIKKHKRTVAGKAIVVPLSDLTPAPNPNESIEKWYIDTINSLLEPTLRNLREKYGQWRASCYWLVFTAITVESSRTWFAIRLSCKNKKALPLSPQKTFCVETNAYPRQGIQSGECGTQRWG